MSEKAELTEDLSELERLFAQTTPGKWKLWAGDVMADQAGDSDVNKAVLVAKTFYTNAEGRHRTNDADWIATAQRNFGELLVAARERNELVAFIREHGSDLRQWIWTLGADEPVTHAALALEALLEKFSK